MRRINILPLIHSLRIGKECIIAIYHRHECAQLMKIFYINVIEQNDGWGSEVFVNRGFQALGHETFTLDYRQHRERLASKFLEVPDFDALFLQRGDYFPLELLQCCSRPCLFWASELVSRRRDQDRLFQCGLFDHIFVRTPQCKKAVVQKRWADPEKISILLSGFDERTHRKLDGVTKEIDVLFVGSMTPRRRMILDRLKQKFNVEIMQVFGEEMARAFNRAKIVLNLHAEAHLDTETRVFEALGAGTFLVSETLSEENPLQSGIHFLEASTLAEMEQIIERYLGNETERERIAHAGHQEAITHHSYTARAAYIASVIQDLLPETKPTVPAIDRNRLQELEKLEQANPHQNQTAQSALRIEMRPVKLRVGIVTTWFERGAAYVSRQYKQALETECDVFVFARGGETYAAGDPVWDDEKVTWAKKPQSAISTAFDLKEFRDWIQRNQINVILFNEQHWWPPVLACAQSGIKIGSYVDYYTEQTIPLFQCYDFLLCNTYRHYSAFDWHPQAVHIPWGTALDLFQPVSFSPVEPGIVTFFHSAGLNPSRKGTDQLLQAFSGLDGPARLVIHSQVSLASYFPHLSGLIKNLEKENRLIRHEKTVTAPGLYHLGDVYVYPSRLEGLGLTVAEALACGLPVITCDNAPMNEFIDESSGVTVPITRLFARHDGYYWPQCLVDIEALRSAMRKYIDEFDALEMKKRAARQHAEKHLDWWKNTENLPRLLNEFKIIPPHEKEVAFRQAQLFEQRRHR